MKVIEVKNISKIYRIGLQEERSEALGSYLLSILSAPFRNFRKLKRLSNFEKDETDEDTILGRQECFF